MKQQTLEEKTIFQQLKKAGVDREIATTASSVASVISNWGIKGGVRGRHIIPGMAENLNYRTPLDFAQLQADVIEGLIVLKDRGFIKLHDGKYELTDKGRRAYDNYA